MTEPGDEEIGGQASAVMAVSFLSAATWEERKEMEEEIICNRWKDLADDFLAADD